MAAFSLSYLAPVVNARAFLRFLLSSRFTRIRYRLASALVGYGVFACRALLVVFLGILLTVSLLPVFLMGGAQ